MKSDDELEVKDSIGYNAQIQYPAYFLNDQELLFVAGRHLVLQQLMSREKHILTTDASAGGKSSSLGTITALSVCPRRKVIAISRSSIPEKNDRKTQVLIYRIQNKVKTSRVTLANTISQSGVSSFQCLSFSHDSTLLACQSSADVTALHIWDWARTRKVASLEIRMKISRIEFNPLDKTQLSTSGATHLRLWKIIDKSLKPLHTSSPGLTKAEAFTVHCWLSNDRLIAASSKCDLVIVRDGAVIDKHLCLLENETIHCISPCNNGLVVGATNGWVSIFTDESNMEITLLRQLQLNCLTTLRHITFDATESNVLICGKNVLDYYRMENIYTFLSDFLIEDQTKSQHLFGLPPSEICSLAICTRKPLLVTCSVCQSFSTVTVWNYKSKEAIHSERFEQTTPLSVDIHPSGYQLLVVFSNRVRLCHLLHDSIKTASEIMLQRTTDAKFNDGGDKFAAVTEKSIRVYATFGGRSGCNPQLLGTFSGHASYISCFCWSQDGLWLYSGDVSGCVYQWSMTDIANGIRSREFTDSRRSCRVVASAADGSVAVAMTSPAGKNGCESIFLWKTFKNTAEDGQDLKHLEEYDYNFEVSSEITCLRLSSPQKIYIGTGDGCLLQFSSQEIRKFELHEKAVKSIVLSVDENLLITGSEDGSVFISEQGPMTTTFLPYEEDVSLLLKSDLEKYETRIAEISVERDEIIAKNAFSENQSKTRHEISFNELKTRFNDLENENRVQKSTFEAEMQKLHDQSEKQLEKEKKENSANMLAMQSLYEAKLTANDETMQEVQKRLEDLKLDKTDSEFSAEEKIFSLKKELGEKFEEELNRVKLENTQLREAKEKMQVDYEALIEQQDEDHMTQLNNIHAIRTQDNASSDSKFNIFRNEISSLQQKIQMLYQALQEKDSVVLEAERKAAVALENLAQAQLVIKRLNEQVANGKTIQTTMSQKEQEYESRILSLERNCRVSDHQLATFKKKIHPKDRALADLSQQLDELHAENERGVGAANELDQQVEENLRKIHVLDLTVKKNELEIVSLNSFIACFSRDLDDIVHSYASSSNADAVERKNQIFDLHEKYVVSRQNVVENIQENRESNNKALREMAKQKELVNSSMKGLRKRLVVETRKRERMVKKSVQQSAMVVEEMNMLRKRNHELQLEIQRLQSLDRDDRPPKPNIRSAGARPISAVSRPKVHKTNRQRPGTAVGPRITIKPKFETTYTIMHTGITAKKSNQEATS